MSLNLVWNLNRKPKWESLSTEINFLKNDVIGCLRDVAGWIQPIKAEKTVMTLLDSCVIRPGKLNFMKRLTVLGVFKAVNDVYG